MKTILVATDFSSASHNAAVYALSLAKAIDAKIILFNAYKVPQPAPALSVGISRYDVMMQIDGKLLDEADILDPSGKIMEIICDEGVPGDTIINIANEKKVDMIVCGMKGGGKNLKKIFGSTASALAKATDIPVLIIPENAAFEEPRIIVFASDHAETEIPQRLKELSKLFQSKIYVVKVVRSVKVLQENGEHILTRKEPGSETILEYFVDDDVTSALNEFIDLKHADIVAMIPHKHGWIERFLIKSETKEMIFHTHIPLLILPGHTR